MPTLPNYSTRFNPRTGEQSYLDSGANQWTPGPPNPTSGMNPNSQPSAPLGPYGLNSDMTWEQANQYQAALMHNAKQQLVTGGNMGGGPGTYRWPSTVDPYSDLRSQSDRDQQAMRNSFSNTQSATFGFMANPARQAQAPAQRTRVYGPSFNLPRYNGGNS